MERRFRLGPVLRYRKDVEDGLQIALAALLQEEQAARAQLNLLREETVRSMGMVRELQIAERLDVGAIAQGYVYLDALQGAIAEQVEVVSEALRRVESKRREVIAAMQDRKIIEKLKQRHDHAYANWMKRSEEKASDDMATVRYNRRLIFGEGSDQ